MVNTRPPVGLLSTEMAIGNFKVYNTPFYILDFKSGNKEADQYTGHTSCVIGLDLMKTMEVSTIDFENHTITFPTDKARNFERPDMCINDGNIFALGTCDRREFSFLIDTGDTGTGFLYKGF